MLGHYVKSIFRLEQLPLFDGDEMKKQALRGYRGPVGSFTHQPLEWETQTGNDLNVENTIIPFKDSRVLFITRHPLDVMVSSYMHAKFKAPKAPYLGSLSDFIYDPVYGLDKFLVFHELWARHHHQVRGFLLWRYEDLRAAPEVQLRALLGFLDIEVNEAAILDAVKFSSFDNLKALEASGERLVYPSSGFRAFGDGPRDEPNAFHVRKGQVGGYREEMSQEMAAELEARIRSELSDFFRYR